MKCRGIPTTAEWSLGFVGAVVLLERFFIDAYRQGLMIHGGLFRVETLNMPGGCLVTVDYPLLEVLALGVLFAGILRVLRVMLDVLRRA
jgi:hypothetical protein